MMSTKLEMDDGIVPNNMIVYYTELRNAAEIDVYPVNLLFYTVLFMIRQKIRSFLSLEG